MPVPLRLAAAYGLASLLAALAVTKTATIEGTSDAGKESSVVATNAVKAEDAVRLSLSPVARPVAAPAALLGRTDPKVVIAATSGPVGGVRQLAFAARLPDRLARRLAGRLPVPSLAEACGSPDVETWLQRLLVMEEQLAMQLQTPLIAAMRQSQYTVRKSAA